MKARFRTPVVYGFNQVSQSRLTCFTGAFVADSSPMNTTETLGKEHDGLWSSEELIRDYFRKPVTESSLKWLWRMRRAKIIPSIKLGRDVFFDINAVRTAIAKRNTIRAKL